MAQSVFKFLDPYTKEDINRFFGREEETNALYEMSFNTRLMLIYGASGTGKTSIVQCGLANRFGDTRWKELYIRRGSHIMQSLQYTLRAELERYAYEGMELPDDPVESVSQLQRLVFTPVYLIFDQFEELFILSPDEQEKKEFFTFARQVTDPNSSLVCHMLLVVREEFIARLWDFEKMVPTLFNYRYRIERMRPDRVEAVIQKMLELPNLQVDPNTSRAVVNRLAMGSVGIELTYLQVYLERLYKQAEQEAKNDTIVLSTAVVEKMGVIRDVIGDFLDDELRKLETQLPQERRGLPLQLLGAMVSDEKTKKVLSSNQLEELRTRLGMTKDEFQLCMRTFERMKIIRRYEV